MKGNAINILERGEFARIGAADSGSRSSGLPPDHSATFWLPVSGRFCHFGRLATPA